MSLNLVNGFEDIINKCNLTTNGAFRIDQRGNFSTWAPCKVGDYLCDCWKVDSQGIDYVEADFNGDAILFRGHGRKGQSISLENRDKELFGRSTIEDQYNRSALTAACQLYLVKGQLRFNVSPRWDTVNDTLTYSKDVRCKIGRGTGLGNSNFEAVRVYKTRAFAFDREAYIGITLDADGEFEFWVHNFRELSGAYRNPPQDCFVPYAEDLQRCERYYQTGSLDRVYLPLRSTAGSMYCRAQLDFSTVMAGTPSVSAGYGSNFGDLYQIAELGTNTILNDPVSNWNNPTTSGIDARGCRIEMQRTSVAANISIAAPFVAWTAEIA